MRLTTKSIIAQSNPVNKQHEVKGLLILWSEPQYTINHFIYKIQ